MVATSAAADDAFERAWAERAPAPHEMRATAAMALLVAVALVDSVVLQSATLNALLYRAPAWLQCVAAALLFAPPAMAAHAARGVYADKARARALAGPRVQYVYVEGNMGAGKSTLLRRCAAPLRALLAARGIALEVVPEPVARWTDVSGTVADNALSPAAAGDVHNLLAHYYADQPRWGLAFQTHALVTRIEALDRAVERVPPGRRVVVLGARGVSVRAARAHAPPAERSIHIDRHVFVHALRATNRMSPLESAIYADAYGFWSVIVSAREARAHNYARAKRLLPGHTAAVVYLRVEPGVCEANVRERGREEERCVALDYLRALHTRHDELLGAGAGGASAGGGDWWDAERLVLDETALRGLPDDNSVAARLAAEMAAFII